ncbi:hypothetical protein T4E_1925 [Trichinella pseudospiralis]|uniref:MULE transposase domain-containing protein n=1 Tax=Trichinella pseudospiralis TaxID=6337 RepID=A0A0V0XJ92_TRIPS|nr:hypothetical protein T4E_1925 [Trichinella pseudospiralis]
MGQIIVEALNDCLPDSDALYEKEKKNTLEGQEAEEMKNCSVQKIGENFSSVASNPPGAYIPPHWRVTKSPQTIICGFETVLIPAVQGSFPCVYIQGCYFHLCQAVVRKVTILGMRTRNILEVARRKTLLVDEWDSVETLNQQMTSGRVTADDL